MAIKTKTVYECDGCHEDIPTKHENLLPAGATLGGRQLASDHVFCGKCLCKQAGYEPPVRTEVVYQSSSSGGGWKGPSGRPFATEAPLRPGSTSWSDSAPGPGCSPSGSGPRSISSARLLSLSTPGT